MGPVSATLRKFLSHTDKSTPLYYVVSILSVCVCVCVCVGEMVVADSKIMCASGKGQARIK